VVVAAEVVAEVVVVAAEVVVVKVAQPEVEVVLSGL